MRHFNHLRISSEVTVPSLLTNPMRATQSRAAQQRSEPSPHTEQGRLRLHDRKTPLNSPCTRRVYYSNIKDCFLFVIRIGLKNDERMIFNQDDGWSPPPLLWWYSPGRLIIGRNECDDIRMIARTLLEEICSSKLVLKIVVYTLKKET